MRKTDAYDVAVVGGGTVGCVLCMLIAQTDPTARMLLIDKGGARPPTKTFAITRGSELVLKAAGVWEDLRPLTHPIQRAEVSMADVLGLLSFDAEDLKGDFIGHSIFAPDLDKALRNRVSNLENCDRVEGAFIRACKQGESVRMEFEEAGEAKSSVLSGACVITASPESALRPSGFRGATHRYRQTIISCRIEGKLLDPNLAVERFARNGVYACVPHGAGCGLIVCAQDANAQRMLQMNDQMLLEHMLQSFGRPLLDGNGRITDKASFPLALSLSSPTHIGSVCLLGSALQTVHPIGGQGLNLALRDAYVWSELYGMLRVEQSPVPEMLSRFKRLRAFDRKKVVLSTHMTAMLEAGGCKTARCIGGLGLTALHAIRPLRKCAARSIFVGDMAV